MDRTGVRKLKNTVNSVHGTLSVLERMMAEAKFVAAYSEVVNLGAEDFFYCRLHDTWCNFLACM